VSLANCYFVKDPQDSPSIAKMLSGWNAFEISDIQDVQLNRRNPAIRCNNVALG